LYINNKKNNSKDNKFVLVQYQHLSKQIAGKLLFISVTYMNYNRINFLKKLLT